MKIQEIINYAEYCSFILSKKLNINYNKYDLFLVHPSFNNPSNDLKKILKNNGISLKHFKNTQAITIFNANSNNKHLIYIDYKNCTSKKNIFSLIFHELLHIVFHNCFKNKIYNIDYNKKFYFYEEKLVLTLEKFFVDQFFGVKNEF